MMRLLPEPAPALPPFKSLLVHGPYLPSAPFRLAFSVPPPHHTIFFTPSRHTLLQALQNQDNGWLNARSGTGSVASMSSRVALFYPPSSQHLVAVLAMLRAHDVSSVAPAAPNVTLDRAPALLVLHEPSAYFLREQEESTLSSYLLLITHALATIECLSLLSPILPTASLVVFDTGLDRLKLPVLRTLPGTAFSEHDGPKDAPKPESVLFLAEKYFELSGIFQLHGQTDSDPRTPVFVLHRTREAMGEEKPQRVAEAQGSSGCC